MGGTHYNIWWVCAAGSSKPLPSYPVPDQQLVEFDTGRGKGGVEVLSITFGGCVPLAPP